MSPIRFLLALAALQLACPAVLPAHSIDAGDDCRCEDIRETAGWCGHCEVGYLAGEVVHSRMFVEALDPQGHPVDTATLECSGCRAAAASNGICASCGWGLANGRIYASRLTYYVALGDQESAPALQEYQRLLQALERLADCETCGVACYFGSTCPTCQVTYRDGHPVPSDGTGVGSETAAAEDTAPATNQPQRRTAR